MICQLNEKQKVQQESQVGSGKTERETEKETERERERERERHTPPTMAPLNGGNEFGRFTDQTG